MLGEAKVRHKPEERYEKGKGVRKRKKLCWTEQGLLPEKEEDKEDRESSNTAAKEEPIEA
jgi:hypothetical protein